VPAGRGKGLARAQCNLGFCYCRGIGLEKNEEEAVIWLMEAADQGYPRALYLLGECYEHGRGVEKEPVTALEYYERAQEKGYKKAAEAIARLDSVQEAGGWLPPERQKKQGNGLSGLLGSLRKFFRK
ncbi:MAG: sel1 repeat family protein, partial [Oscillospiraceae bacterium]|nr:sel1 repeat family protein [Oscillospiraceae bacterium]